MSSRMGSLEEEEGRQADMVEKDLSGNASLTNQRFLFGAFRAGLAFTCLHRALAKHVINKLLEVNEGGVKPTESKVDVSQRLPLAG